MPFKPGKSPTDVSKKIQRILTTELDANIEKGLFTIYTMLSGTADFYVPVDTSTLVQSRDYRIREESNRWQMTYGYYTKYAQYLHDSNNWSPKQPGTPGKPNGGYNPNARSDWLNVAWAEVGQDAIRQFANMVEPK
jgi:hypothetical protein